MVCSFSSQSRRVFPPLSLPDQTEQVRTHEQDTQHHGFDLPALSQTASG